MGWIQEGRRVHGDVIKNAYELDMFVQNVLVHILKQNCSPPRIFFSRRNNWFCLGDFKNCLEGTPQVARQHQINWGLLQPSRISPILRQRCVKNNSPCHFSKYWSPLQ
ncbi:hypothetical protein SUGI_1120800 [Cryptomeria japonica]|nr:hypothetical protein SUGI_1120800 [Cryptomeria japonica]